MPVLDRGSARIYYDVQGEPTERPPLLLSHGFSASGRMWDRNVGALAADREVLTWDMRGHARSDSPTGASRYGVEQSIEDMLTLLDVLAVPRAALGGMSLGGYLSLAFLARHPERVAALILVDTGPGFRSEEPRREWNVLAERTAAALERDGLAALSASPEVGEHRDAVGLVHTARHVMAQRDAHVIDSLERIAVPTLVVVGALDTNFLSAADYMAAKIPGARKVVLDGAGHAANIDACEEFNAVVREFLEEI
jgi:pimeloyl-ACP methyl ester carboxylesterase